jgi:hypothetical protein
MATLGVRFICTNCTNDVEAWEGGVPYYFDRQGMKKYAYHTDPNVERCVGRDTQRLCMACGAKAMVDSGTRLTHCFTCNSDKIASLLGISGRMCPYCKIGSLTEDYDFHCVSPEIQWEEERF